MRDLRYVWRLGWRARLDAMGHLLHLPDFFQRRLCDAFEKSLDHCYWVPDYDYTSSVPSVQWTWTNKG